MCPTHVHPLYPSLMEQRARIEIARVVDARVVEDEASPTATGWLGYIYPGVRRHTVYTIEAVLGASASGDPVRSQRRYSAILQFHEQWVLPVMSRSRPVPMPAKELALFKNSEGVVADRMSSLQDWVNSAIQLARRLGSLGSGMDRALQNFLHGDDVPPPLPADLAVWDVAGEWVFRSQATIAGETYHVPHTLLLSAGEC
jgi:hypothetical protein